MLPCPATPLRAQNDTSATLRLRPFVPTLLPVPGLLKCDSALTALAWAGIDSTAGAEPGITPPRGLKGGTYRLPEDLEETGGRLVADFVVDSTGAIRACSFRLVSTTDARLLPIALNILADTRYAPARNGGRDVAASVRQVIRFPGVPRPDR